MSVLIVGGGFLSEMKALQQGGFVEGIFFCIY